MQLFFFLFCRTNFWDYRAVWCGSRDAKTSLRVHLGAWSKNEKGHYCSYAWENAAVG